MIATLRFSIRQLVSDDDRQAFADGFCRALEARSRGVLKGNVPLDYLRASRVTGVFDPDRRLVAGYVIGTAQPFRLFEFVPLDARRSLAPPEGSTWDDFCELTCVWKADDVSPLYMSAVVWPRALAEAVRSGRRYILGHNQSPRLDAIYMKTRTGVTLYAGPSTASLPSRLSAHPTRGFWKDAVRVVLLVSAERAIRARRRQ